MNAAEDRSRSVLVLHLEDNGPYDALRELIEAQGYRYRQVRNPNHLLLAFGIPVSRRDQALGNPASGARRLRPLIKRARSVIVILDEHLETGAAARRKLYRPGITGSYVARKLAPLGTVYLRYSGCYENSWNTIEQGRGVIYKEDYGPQDALRVLALIRRILDAVP